MYIAKVAVKGFSSYTYLYRLATYLFWPRDNMPGLSPSANEEEIILDTYLQQNLYSKRSNRL